MDISESENSDVSDIDPDFEYDSADDDSEDGAESEEDFSNSESDDDIDPVQFGEWKIVGDPCQDERDSVIYEKDFPYDIHPGLNLSEPKTPKECFEAFVSRDIVIGLCKWTNERALMYLEQNNNLALKIHGLYWRDVTVSEMYIFISLVFIMSQTHLPKISDYWRKDFLLQGPPVFSAKIMSRSRFLVILKFLRFSNPRTVDTSKPISRLAMFFAYIRQNTTIFVDVGKTFALDECLMLYKGRLHFKQFIKTKRAHFGVKLFCVCPSNPLLRGYTYDFALYIGKDINNVAHMPNTENLSMSERVVVHLIQNLLEDGREVILDNWYLSVRLAEFLLSKNTYVTGTIKQNRGVPKELAEVPLQRGQSCFLRKKDLLLVRYKDKRDVYVLTTKLTAGFQDKCRYDTMHKKEISYKKPDHIEHYNLNMGAVDAIDQDLEPYNAARKNYSWFKKLGIHIMQRMLLNAKVFYCISNNSKISLTDFTRLLCDNLLAAYKPGYEEMRDSYNKRKTKIPFAKEKTHNLICLPKNEQKRRRCWVCYNTYKNKNKYTVSFCSQCKIALCSMGHFEEYHSNLLDI